MDADQGHERHHGGTVEPAGKGKSAAQPTRAASEPSAQRFELRDPFAEVTYRFTTPNEVIRKADELGATRFHMVDADEKRTQVNKADGDWRTADGEVLSKALRRDRESRDGGSKVVPILATQPSPPATGKQEPSEERAVRVEQLEAALQERYVIKRPALHVGSTNLGLVEYRFRGDITRVAFTEAPLKLSTDTDNPSVARSMVDVAEARGWRALRVSGSEDFRRMVWLDATLRGVKTLGYEPHHEDVELLRKEREARRTNRIEAAVGQQSAAAPAHDARPSTRGSGGRKAVLATLRAVLVDKGVPERQREAVMAAAEENLTQRQRAGQTVKVKVYDKAAPPPKAPVIRPPEIQRSHERASPTR
jgi:hypothetical protein